MNLSTVLYKRQFDQWSCHNQTANRMNVSYTEMQLADLETTLCTVQCKFDAAVCQMRLIDQKIADAKVRLVRINRGSTYWQMSSELVSTLQGVRRMYMKYAQKQVAILNRCQHRLAELAAQEDEEECV